MTFNQLSKNATPAAISSTRSGTFFTSPSPAFPNSLCNSQLCCAGADHISFKPISDNARKSCTKFWNVDERPLESTDQLQYMYPVTTNPFFNEHPCRAKPPTVGKRELATSVGKTPLKSLEPPSPIHPACFPHCSVLTVPALHRFEILSRIHAFLQLRICCHEAKLFKREKLVISCASHLNAKNLIELPIFIVSNLNWSREIATRDQWLRSGSISQDMIRTRTLVTRYLANYFSTREQNRNSV